MCHFRAYLSAVCDNFLPIDAVCDNFLPIDAVCDNFLPIDAVCDNFLSIDAGLRGMLWSLWLLFVPSIYTQTSKNNNILSSTSTVCFAGPT